MITIQALSGIPEAVAGLPVSVIIPAITLGFLAAIIALRLNRARNRTI
jgi:VIT1/CCC1 family predicted Fe2+/Mn2+ transporter